MKKLAYLAFLLAVLGLIIAGCEKMHSPVEAPGPELGGVILSLPGDICGQPTEVRLLAGQNIDIGTVTVANDGVNLYVEYDITTGGWYMTETHLHVATDPDDIPQTKKGNPIPGQFEYKMDHDPAVTEYTYTIPLDWDSRTPLYIAAHAAVIELTGGGCDSPQWASNVVDYVQGPLADGNPIYIEDRKDPNKALGAPDGTQSGTFYSLGFSHDYDGDGVVDDGYIVLSFDNPVYNGDGDDIVVYEVTWGNRTSYYDEAAEVYVIVGDDEHYAGTVTNKEDGGQSGKGWISIPEELACIDAVKLVDDSYWNPNKFLDGYDVDAVGACYLCEGEETAWGEGPSFPGNNWGMYFEYTVQECPPPEGCETAFAYYDDEEYATCFLDIDEDGDPGPDFHRWGWTNGPLGHGNYEFDIYAGAGQCVLSKGTLVGQLTVNYDGSSELVTVTYSMNGGFTLEEVHLYVGNEILPRNKKGNFTVAPGLYPYKAEDLNGATEHTFTVDVSGNIYVVAHAVVCGD